MKFKIINKYDKEGKITLCCPQKHLRSDCQKLQTVDVENWNITQEGLPDPIFGRLAVHPYTCYCGLNMIPYVNWIISEMSEYSIKLSEEFIKKHRCSEEIAYIVESGGGIGISIYITCLKCGETKNITDYDEW